MALRRMCNILIIIILQTAMSSGLNLLFRPELTGFHKLLSKDQLMKYFNVQNYDDVPEYNFVNIGLKILDPLYWADKFGNFSSGQIFQPQEMFISAESIFGHPVQMELKRNNKLMAPSFKVFTLGDDDAETELLKKFPVCHYIGVNDSITAALSSCQYTSTSQYTKGLSGVLLLPDEDIQIRAVDEELAKLLGLVDHQVTRFLLNSVVEHMHLVFKPKMKSFAPDEPWEINSFSDQESGYKLEDNKTNLNKTDVDFDQVNSISDSTEGKLISKIFPRRKKRTSSFEHFKQMKDEKSNKEDLQVELALFLDKAGYERFMPFMKTEKKLVELLLGFVNQVQALYKQDSLSRKVQISLVRLQLLKKQPVDLPHSNGATAELIEKFCQYQDKRNPDNDDHPDHWDIALLLTGFDLYVSSHGMKIYDVLGASPEGGVCSRTQSCVLAEFGAVASSGKPEFTSGFFSTYIATHEIGHNLGMPHDGPPRNKCPKTGLLMSAFRGTKGHNTWSKCSSKFLEKIDKNGKECLFDIPQAAPKPITDHTKFNEKPGQFWNAAKQCKIFLRDNEATLFDKTALSMACQDILCKSPQHSHIFAGPALEGTHCGEKKWCQSGKCVSRD